MKNSKKYSALMLALVLGFISSTPAVASANLIKIDLDTSGKIQTPGDRHTDARVNVEGAVQVGRFNDEKRDGNHRDGKESEERDSRRVLQTSGSVKMHTEEVKPPHRGWFSWFERFYSHGTTTVSVVLPIVHKVGVRASTTSASIDWNTSASTTGEVRFGTTMDLSTSTNVVDGTMSENHTINLVGLTADTIYYFTITARDSSGNVKTTSITKFHTKEISRNVQAPRVIFSTAVDTRATSTRIIWFTNEKSDSRVWVGTSRPVDTAITNSTGAAEFVHIHDLEVAGLATSTTYFYVVKSADAQGNISTSASGSFVTTIQ
jgi:chitodextrinase